MKDEVCFVEFTRGPIAVYDCPVVVFTVLLYSIVVAI